MNTQMVRLLGSLLLTIVTVASLVITYRRSQKRNAPPAPRPQNETAPVEIMELPEPGGLDPFALQKDMDAYEPDQLAKLNALYRGRALSWLVLFKERKPVPDSEMLSLRFLEQYAIVNVLCEVDPAQFPEQEHWAANEKIRVSGTIENVSESAVQLTEVNLTRA